MTTMLAAVQNSGVTTGYKNQYEVLVALDTRSGYQDCLMLAANPSLVVVPEPSSVPLGRAGVLLTLRRRRA